LPPPPPLAPLFNKRSTGGVEGPGEVTSTSAHSSGERVGEVEGRGEEEGVEGDRELEVDKKSSSSSVEGAEDAEGFSPLEFLSELSSGRGESVKVSFQAVHRTES
jgi:hypothetical protein